MCFFYLVKFIRLAKQHYTYNPVQYPLSFDTSQRLNCAFIVGLSLLLPYIFRNQRLVEKTVRVLKQLDLTAGEYFNTVESPA